MNGKERCQSGRSGRTRNAVNGQLFPGFESLSFRYTFYRHGLHGLHGVYLTVIVREICA